MKFISFKYNFNKIKMNISCILVILKLILKCNKSKLRIQLSFQLFFFYIKKQINVKKSKELLKETIFGYRPHTS